MHTDFQESHKLMSTPSISFEQPDLHLNSLSQAGFVKVFEAWLSRRMLPALLTATGEFQESSLPGGARQRHEICHALLNEF